MSVSVRSIAILACVLVAVGCAGHSRNVDHSARTLSLPYPVASVSADGTRVAVAAAPHSPQLTGLRTPPFILWDARSGAVARFPATRCAQPTWTTLTGTRIVVDCVDACCDSAEDNVVAYKPGLARVVLFRAVSGFRGSAVGTAVTGLAGAKGTVAFSTETAGDSARSSLYVVDGSHVRRIRRHAGVVVDARGPFVVTVLPSHAVLVLRRDGTRAHKTPYPGRTAFIDRRRVASVVYNEVWEAGQPHAALEDLPLAPGTTIGGSVRGLLAYVTADAVHVLRLDDGHDARFALGDGYPVAADITDAGLFYAVDRVPPWRDPDQSEGRYRTPSRVVFVPLREVLSRVAVSH